MAEPSELAGVGESALDRAHGLHLAGDAEAALKLCASILTATPELIGAAALLGRLMLDAGQRQLAQALGERSVDGFIRRGDLPAARVAAALVQDAGGDGTAACQQIARAFGSDSLRPGEAASIMPPPLSAAAAAKAAAPFFAELAGEALLEATRKTAERFLASEDPVSATRALPRLPLFGELAAPSLAALLGLMRLEERAAGAAVLREGERGDNAWVLVRGVLNVVRAQGQAPSLGSRLLAALGPGAIFGEMALVSRAPRAASVVAVEPVQLLAMPRAELERLAASDASIGNELGRFCQARMISNLIHHGAILRELDSEARGAVMERFGSRRFETGQALVRQGDEPAGLYLVASGGVQVRSRDADGERLVLAELGPGEVVGEISLVLRRPANADVVALHPTVVLELTAEDFREVIREHPALLKELYEIAVARDEETRSVVAQQALDASDVVLV
ncbi:MAG: cyclic nucleotide-binding domain-containing protein [Myxococcales bacterium]|nr:cyclic nucleotide-binding domain-containing protein [Myxococcales bacterium]